MKSFIKRSEAIEIDEAKIDKLIERFNTSISTNQPHPYHLNNALNNIPILTELEFNAAKSRAAEGGYILEKYEDNYNTITYKLTQTK